MITKHNRAWVFLCFGSTLLAPQVASAQTYLNTTRTETFTQLDMIPGITSITPVSFSSTDDGFVEVTLPFTFNFLGADKTRVRLGTNGFLTLGDATTIDAATSLSNQTPGSSGAPNNWIAPLWDDLIHPATANARWGILGTAPNRAFIIEGGPATRYSGSGGTLRYQVWLFEGPNRKFEYRAAGNPVLSLNATVGYEGPSGIPNHNPLGCGNTCSATSGWVDTVFSTFIATEPELTGSIAAFPRGALPGNSATVDVIFRNLAVDTATSVQGTIYLSTDNTLDALDVMVGSVTPIDVPGGNTPVPTSGVITVPPGTTPGDYVLILQVDSDNAWPEANEADNNVPSGSRFATAYDIRPTSISLQPSGASPGDTVPFDITLANDGVPYVGPVELDIILSVDQILDSNDHHVGIVVVNMTGAPTDSFVVNVTVPSSLTPGRYYPGMTADPMTQIVEYNETNNSIIGANSFPVGHDFQIASITIPSQIGIGSSGTMTTRINSLAAPYTGVVTYRLYASADTMFDMMDTSLGTFTASFAGQASLDLSENVTPPTLPAGRYYVIGIFDPANTLREVSETNNETVSATSFINAPDFAVSTLTVSPATVEAGQNLTVSGSIQSLGLTFTGNVPYRVYFSPDNMFDGADEAAYDGLIFLAGLASTPISAVFPIPNNVPVRSFYAIVVIDPDNTIAEAVETNNANASTTSFTIRGADLIVEELISPTTAFIGLPFDVTLTVVNEGAANANNFRYAYYLSENDLIRFTDMQIYVSDSATIASGATQVFQDTLTLPTFTATQTLYLGVLLDIYSNVPEDSEPNNSKAVGPLSIVFPIPDLTAQIIETATAAAAGEQLAITRVLLNAGVADAPGFEYGYYLSSNPTITADDVLIGSFTSMLGVAQDDFGFDVLTIPSEIPAGTYYIGLLVDPDDQLLEVNEGNNVALGPQIPVYSAAIQFLTMTLPDATLGANYQVGVYASGGPIGITWAVRSGDLPPGLALDPATGIISGSPTTEGLYSFVLRALSGTAYADQEFSIRVLSPTVPLRIASTTLQSAIVGREYTTQIVAVGGTVPYEWSAVSVLPETLTLSADGVLSGIPQAQGNNRITVRVRDSIGGTASKELALNVINPNQKLVISQIVLPTGVVGLDYCGQDQIQLEANGGIPPYSWSAVGEVPAGMVFGADGTFCGTPEAAGSFPVTVRVQDQTGLFDTSLFILDVDDGRELAIATFTLPNGALNTAYDAAITAVRGDPPYEWSTVPFSGDLPPGLSLNPTTGHVTGTPSTAGIFAFTVQVIDAKDRTDLQPLSIEIPEQTAPPMQTDTGCGCAAVESKEESNMGSWAIFAVLGVALVFARRGRRVVRRRGLWGSMLAAAVALAVPSLAEAQPVPGTPYFRTVSTITYTPLATPITTIFTSGDDVTTAVPLPFSFRYYDNEVSNVWVGTNGAVSFDASASISLSNTSPGSSGTPNNLVALFWDDQQLFPATDHYIAHKTEGTAPNRTFTIEWRNLSRYGNSGVTFSMMLRLFEGPAARLQIDYGPISGSGSFSASMGMEDHLGGRPIIFPAVNCGASCTQTDFAALSNRRIDLVQDPGVELIARSIDAPQFGFLGAAVPVIATLGNLHGAVIGPFQVQIVASNTPDLASPTVVHSSDMTLSAFQIATVSLDMVPPQMLGEGLYYLGLLVDSGNTVMEVNESNNTAVSSTQIRVREGKADLSVERVATDVTSANAGDTVPVVIRVKNVGGLPANNAQIAMMLSTNPVASPQDVQLSTFNVSLQAGEATEQTVNVMIPSATNSGAYYLGVLADPPDTIDELSESNNGRTTSSAINISGGTLAIVTTALPVGYVRTTYIGLLTAVGGDAMKTWRVTTGMLPTGIGLVPSSGELFGRPTLVESQTFTVEVTSGMQTATQQLTLMVVSPEEPLTVVTRSIPTGVVGQEYSFELVATGGSITSTRTWSANGLPAGMTISPDGVLGGTPETTGTSTLTVSVSDGIDTAERELTLSVRNNDNLLIVPTRLPNAQFNVAYNHQFEADGGLRPLTWLIQVGTLPTGMDVSTAGVLSGTPTQVGTFRFIIEARDAGPPGRQAKDVNSFELVVEDVAGFTIATTSLPDATVEEGYDQSIRSMGGTPPINWSIIEGTLPEGLIGSINTAANEFRIAGTPAATGTSNILLEATDSQGRVTARALAIRVMAKPPMLVTMNDDTGCNCAAASQSSAAGTTALFGLLALALVIRRRR